MLKIFIILLIIFTLSTQKPIDDNDTKAAFNSKNKARCSHPEQYLTSKNYKERKPWNKKHLTYKITKNDIYSINNIRNATELAIKGWTKNIDLTISESSNKSADIFIYFKKIDGTGNLAENTLAYAFYPEIGDMYFDKADTWSFENPIPRNTFSFNWVMVHEMGHSLGLVHDNEDITSIMYPYYSDDVSTPNTKDLERIFGLYGPKSTTKFLDNTILCANSSFDIMFTTSNGEHAIMKESLYWTFNENGLQSGPHDIKKIFPKMPETQFDAIFSIDSKSLLLKKNYFYIYDNIKYTKNKMLQLPENIDCGFTTEQNISYIFKEPKYYMVDSWLNIEREDSINQTFNNVQNNIAKCLYMDPNIYFIKNNVYSVIDIKNKNIIKSGDVEDEIFKCYN